MERDLVLLLLGGAIGVAATTIGALLNYELQRRAQHGQWAHEEALRREQFNREDIEKLRGGRDVDTVLKPIRWYCFAYGTRVSMSDRGSRPIEELQIGDELLTYEHVSRRFPQAKVTRLVRGETSEHLLLNGCLAVTLSHMVYADGAFIAAGGIRPGMSGLSSDGQPLVIGAIERKPGRCAVIHLDIDSNDGFFAELFLVGTWLAKQPLDGERDHPRERSLDRVTSLLDSSQPVKITPTGEIVTHRS